MSHHKLCHSYGFVLDCWFKIPNFSSLVPVDIAPSKKRACREDMISSLSPFAKSHRCLPFSLFMSISRRCLSSRPLTASGRCVSRWWLRDDFMYMRLSTKKKRYKRGLVYPKLAQSKGSDDRMHSPDLFWGSRRVSAAPPSTGSRSRESVPQARGMNHLSKVL
jgi:hypothetical protein